MAKINDTGKVWIRGSVKPVFAVKVDNGFFVPGKDDDHFIQYWVEGKFLCFDMHNTKKEIRIGRRFSLDSVPETPATLFNGFKKTHHTDVMVATDKTAETFILEGGNYISVNAASLASQAFWRLALSSWSK